MSESVSGKAFETSLLRRIYSYVLPYRKLLYITVLLTILMSLLTPMRPYLIQYTFDKHILGGDTRGLLNMTFLLILLLVLQSLVQYYHSYLTTLLGQNVIKDLRVQLFGKILSFRMKYFDRTPVGVLQTRLVSDMETIADIFSEGLIIIIGDILQLAVVIGVMFYIDWRLTLISFSTIPVLLVASNIFQRGVKATFQEVRTQVARLNTFLQEHITGMSIVQVFNREEEEMKKFSRINELHKEAHIHSVWYYSIFFPVVEILSAASIGMMVWWGAREIMGGFTTLGTLISFIMYINMVFRPIRELADKFNTLQMGMVSSERIFRVLDTREEIENKGEISSSSLKGEIAFEDVWFAYNEENWVLKGVSFRVEAGQTLALVGATGAGKTSIISLLGRFYEINKGRITIDGIDIREYELPRLREQMAFVLQDVFLFSDTVYNNISLKNPRVSREQVIRAGQVFGADRFITNLPGGYDFNVQERGASLSVGQRQLISFIRAYVQNPRILILDEATSSIDNETEMLIQGATNALTANRTSVVIAHRLATILNASQILVLDHGELKEKGTHRELISRNGYYRRLYEIQFERTRRAPATPRV